MLASLLHWPWQHPAQGESKPVGLLRAVLRVLFIFCREFQRDAIPLRASALTFTIVLSLVPILALGTAVLKGLGSGDEMRQTAYRFLDQLDAGGGAPAALPSPNGTGDDREADQPMTSHLRRATDQIFAAVDRTNFSALGAFGVLGLLVSVLGVLISIETALNTIWQAEKGRSLGRKLMNTLACTILLPLSINLALATGAVVHHQTLLRFVHNTAALAWLSGTLVKFLPFVLLIATFTLLYSVLPNTRVRFWPALAGGLVGGVSWVVVQSIYVSTQIAVVRFNAIYGSFATIPLFLLWLYLAWIVFLAGAEAAFVMQAWRGYDWLSPATSPVSRLSLAFQVLEAMDTGGRARQVSHSDSLLASLPTATPHALQTILAALEQGDLIRQTTEGGYLLVTPLDAIAPAEVVAIIFGAPAAQSHPLANQAFAAATNALHGHRLGQAPLATMPRSWHPR